jgi:hypothetical protein
MDWLIRTIKKVPAANKVLEPARGQAQVPEMERSSVRAYMTWPYQKRGPVSHRSKQRARAPVAERAGVWQKGTAQAAAGPGPSESWRAVAWAASSLPGAAAQDEKQPWGCAGQIADETY